MESSKNAVVLL